MKIALISLSTPTFNNVRAASALPYHLIDGSKEHQFKIYSFDVNHVEKDEQEKTKKALHVELNILSRPKWITRMFRFHLAFLRVFLKYPFSCYYNLPHHIIKEIKRWNPDKIWIYGEELAGLAEHFYGIETTLTMPDCESMYYHRLLSKRFATQELSQILRYSIAYYQYRSMEQNLWYKDVKYHFVGKADEEFYKEINPQANAIFLPHPIYGYADKRTIRFHQPKIKILVAGRYDIYMQEACDDAFQVFLDNKEFINHYEITFLGKDWDNWCKQLKECGYNSQHVRFAPDYIEELVKHDIQLSPISVGTGTKGKVLDAFANGLMVIGTPFALENIQVENGKACVCYQTPEELKHYLQQIPIHLNEYEMMAKAGKECVLDYHDKKKIAFYLFG